jgi:GYF domain 2
MKKYYLYDGAMQHGPFNLEELKAKNITAETSIWFDPMPDWKPAGQIEELKDIVIHVPPVFHGTIAPIVEKTEVLTEAKPVVAELEKPVEPVVITPILESVVVAAVAEPIVVEEPVIPAITVKTAEPIITIGIEEPVVPVKPVDPVVIPVAVVPVAPVITVKPATAVAPVVPASKVVKPAKKSTAWVSWVLSLLVLGATGYYVYADMQKNNGKTNSGAITNNTDSVNTLPISQTPTTNPATSETTTDSSATIPIETPTTTTDPTSTSLTPTTTTTPTNISDQEQQLLAKKKTEVEKKRLEEKKKLEEKKMLEDKKKQEENRKLEEKKKQDALNAALAREQQIRNNWGGYVTIGSVNYKPKDDGISAFAVPVNNASEAVLDKVTVRVDYYKKEGRDKLIKSETIVINNVPPKSTVNGMAPENKKCKKVSVFITGIISKKLHFCYPQNNGNAADPYYCN